MRRSSEEVIAPRVLALTLAACTLVGACGTPPSPSVAPAASASTSANAPAAPEWCIDPDHCEEGVKRCLEVCYQRNHPNGPANGECDDGCRQSYCARVLCPPR